MNNTNKSHYLPTAVWQYGGFWAFLESSLFIQSFVYICNGLVIKSATSPSCKTLVAILPHRDEN